MTDRSVNTSQPTTRPDPMHNGSSSTRILSGSIRRTMILLAMPVLAEQMLNAGVGLFDTYLAGNLPEDVSVQATSAIGLAAYVGWLASMIVMLVGTGTTALVARHEGARDRVGVDRFSSQSVTLAVLLGFVLFGLLYTLAPVFAHYCRMTGDAYAITVYYLRVDAVGHCFLSFTLVASAALRGVGNMRTPMLVFALVNTINVIASCSLVYGLGPFPVLGVNGIVGGTVTARILGAVLMLVILVRGRAGVRLRLVEMSIVRQHARRILKIGVPAAADGALMWGGHFLLLAIIARLADDPLGSAYFAAHIIAIRVEALTYLPAVAWGSATATIIGQSLGAGDAARARRAGHQGVLQCGLLSLVVAFFICLGARLIYQVMSVDPLVRDVGAGPFRLLALLQPVMVVSIVYIHGLRGAGDTRFPLLITIVGVVLRVVSGYVCGIVLHGGLLGAWMGMFADNLWRAFAAAQRFMYGKWDQTRV